MKVSNDPFIEAWELAEQRHADLEERINETDIIDWKDNPVTKYIVSRLEADILRCQHFLYHEAKMGEDTATTATNLEDAESFLAYVKELTLEENDPDEVPEDRPH